jgi:Xaa-Pro aminopeptidase
MTRATAGPFGTETYVARRQRLADQLGSGLVLLPGNGEMPINYTNNEYPFRQDSSFLYFFGVDRPHLVGVLDVDERRDCLFGDDFTLDDIVWRGPQPSIAEQAAAVGVTHTASRASLEDVVRTAVGRGRTVHVLPPYRAENTLELQRLVGRPADGADPAASQALIRAVVAQRSIKSAEEVAEIARAVDMTREMHLLAMRLARPGVFEHEVVGAMEGVALARGGRLSFATIFSVHGETLHNQSHANRMAPGDVVVNDSGAESPRHYAGDITRSIPIGGRFEGARRDLYDLVLEAQRRAIAAIRPGVPYKTVHLLAARTLAEGLVTLGCMRGDVDAAVEAGAHALFFPHGLGHMLGLDVHDMEALGEDHVGYDETVQRSPQFGLRSLRLARALHPGFVLTVEPGLYFIPALIDRWEAERRHADFIDYDGVRRFRDAGGIRIEDDVLVTEDGCRILGQPIPKARADVEALAAA